jgi:hypothetical protein
LIVKISVSAINESFLLKRVICFLLCLPYQRFWIFIILFTLILAFFSTSQAFTTEIEFYLPLSVRMPKMSANLSYFYFIASGLKDNFCKKLSVLLKPQPVLMISSFFQFDLDLYFNELFSYISFLFCVTLLNPIFS